MRAGRARVRCDLGKVVYLTLPNDHGGPLDPQTPTPELMCAVNDEATGLLLDGLSHSPTWADSLLIDPTTLRHLEIVQGSEGAREGSLLDELAAEI